jgi:lysophospholipase L1-like esterase
MFVKMIQRLALLTLAGIATVTHAQSPTTKQPLIITGASYAAGLKQPVLANYTVTNKGVGGETIAQVAARFERDVVAAKPAAVIIWGHINTIHQASGSMEPVHAGIKADYEKMIQQATANNIRVILATETTLPYAFGFMNKVMAFVGSLRGKEGYAARTNPEVNVINDWLRTTARQHGYTLLDFEKAMDDGDGFRKDEYVSDDGTHINDAGYAVLVRVMQTELNR